MSEDKSQSGQREAIPSPKDWDFGYVGVNCILNDIRTVWGDTGTDVLKEIAQLFKWESRLVLNFGHVSIQTAAILLSELNNELRLLTLSKSDFKWGDQTARRSVLKKYKLTDFLFDNNPRERDILITSIEAQRLRVEGLIENLAKEFQIKIPVKQADHVVKEPWNYPPKSFEDIDLE